VTCDIEAGFVIVFSYKGIYISTYTTTEESVSSLNASFVVKEFFNSFIFCPRPTAPIFSSISLSLRIYIGSLAL